MDIREGFVNADYIPLNDKVMKVNLEKPLCYDDNTFEYVFAGRVLEHILNFEQLLFEIWRVCKPNAIIRIEVPHFSSPTSNDCRHVRKFMLNDFDEYENKQKDVKECPAPYPIQFKVIEKRLTFAKGINPFNYIGRIFLINNFMKRVFENTFFRYLISADEIHFRLMVIK